jgi:hypothetical protein
MGLVALLLEPVHDLREVQGSLSFTGIPRMTVRCAARRVGLAAAGRYFCSSSQRWSAAIFGETEATRSPSAVRNSEIGRFVVMRVGSRFSYRWSISR